jgi:transposase-like protein
VDGFNFDMHIDAGIKEAPVVVAIGVTETEQNLVLVFQPRDEESAPPWRDCFKDLKGRSLDGLGMVLSVMVGLPGLEKVFKEKFPKAQVST